MIICCNTKGKNFLIGYTNVVTNIQSQKTKTKNLIKILKENFKKYLTYEVVCDIIISR